MRQCRCPFFSICMVSVPAIRLCANQKDLNPSIGMVILFTARWSCSTMLLRYFDRRNSTSTAGIVIDTANCSSVGSAFVYADLFRQYMQIDGALKEAARSCQIAGGEQEVHCIAALVDCGVNVLSIASNFDVGLIHPPTGSDQALAATKDMRHDWQNLQSPEVHRGMVQEDSSLLHHFLQMAKAQGVSCIPRAHTNITSRGWCRRLSTLRSSGIIADSFIFCMQPLSCLGAYCDRTFTRPLMCTVRTPIGAIH